MRGQKGHSKEKREEGVQTDNSCRGVAIVCGKEGEFMDGHNENALLWRQTRRLHRGRSCTWYNGGAQRQGHAQAACSGRRWQSGRLGRCHGPGTAAAGVLSGTPSQPRTMHKQLPSVSVVQCVSVLMGKSEEGEKAGKKLPRQKRISQGNLHLLQFQKDKPKTKNEKDVQTAVE